MRSETGDLKSKHRPDAENERSDMSDRRQRFGRFCSCDASDSEKVPWVLLLRIVNRQQQRNPLRRIKQSWQQHEDVIGVFEEYDASAVAAREELEETFGVFAAAAAVQLRRPVAVVRSGGTR